MSEQESEAQFAICRCRNCDGSIEFDASQAGENVACPHCGLETLLFIPPMARNHLEEPEPPPKLDATPKPEPVWFGNEASAVEIRLVSGAVLKFKEVRLYDAAKLNFISAQKANAAQLFEGVQSPYRPYGDIGWVVLASKITGMLEDKLTRDNANEGFALVQSIAKQERELREDVHFFHVGQIDEIEFAVPNLWTVLVSGSRFVDGEQEFITVKDTEGTIRKFRWSCVETYEYQA